jgi:hypothetical protein
MNYYKGLFGSPEECNFSMDESRTDDIPMLPLRKTTYLLYAEEEVKKVVFQMERNKAPGLDGFPTEFYQNFWEVMKSDLLELFSFLHAGQLELFHLNFADNILLPKIINAERIQQYRPICLFNVSLKKFHQGCYYQAECDG